MRGSIKTAGYATVAAFPLMLWAWQCADNDMRRLQYLAPPSVNTPQGKAMHDYWEQRKRQDLDGEPQQPPERSRRTSTAGS